MQNAQVHGFLAHLEWDANTGRHELPLLLDLKDGKIPMPIHIGVLSLEEAMRRVTIKRLPQSVSFENPFQGPFGFLRGKSDLRNRSRRKDFSS